MATQRISLPGLLKRVLAEPLSQSSDRQLLDRFAETGDEAAFAAILDRHGPMVRDVCRRVVDDVHLADDVLQATFLVLARKAGSIRKRDSLASWLHGVAQRIARQARLAEAARTRREQRATRGRGEATLRDPGWSELLGVLDEELQLLPERYRSPLLLCYLEGRTQDEAAGQLGWSLTTLRRRLESGRERLRRRMVRRGATLGAGLFAGFLAPGMARATLTPDLHRSVVTTAVAARQGGAVPASIALLANGGMAVITSTRMVLCLALAVAMSGVLAGVVSQTWSGVVANEPAQTRPMPAAEPRDAEPAAEPTDRRDRFNDPLPRGAVARLGTVAFRHGWAPYGQSLTFTLDGKQLVSAGGWIRRWDLATGHAVVNLGDGWRTAEGFGGLHLVTADGKRARACVLVATPPRAPGRGSGVVYQCTECDLENGKELRTYRIEFPRDTGDAHSGPGFLSPDGKTFAELNHSGKLTLWNADDGTVTHHIKPPGEAFTALAFVPDGKTLVVGDEAHTLRVLETATGKELRSFGILRGNAVIWMAISADGKWLATVGGQRNNHLLRGAWKHDGFLRLWDLREGTEARTIALPEDAGVQTLLFTSDSRTVIAGLQGRKSATPVAVRTWDVASGKPGRAWTEDLMMGLILAVSPDSRTLASMNEDGVIRLWDLATGKETNPRTASPCSLEAVAFRRDGKTIRTVGQDQVIREWETATGRLVGPPLSGIKGSYPRFLAAGKLLATSLYRADQPKAIQLHDPATGKLLLEQPADLLVVSPDGKRMATWATDQPLQVLEADTGTVLQTLVLPADKEKPAWPHAPLPRGFTPDGQSLIVQGETVSVWDVRTGRQKTSWSLLEHKVLARPAARDETRSWERIESVAVSPDAMKIAFSLLKDLPENRGSRDWFGRIELRETATGKLLFQADADEENFQTMSFSADGRLLAAGGRWTIRVWDVATGKEIGKFEGHRGPIKSVAFSPDGKRLASASADSTVLVWDVAR